LVAIPVSIKLISAVFRNGALDAYEKLVLLALADYADENGKSWPSIAALAKKCSMCERNVQYSLNELKSKGLIRVEYVSGGRSYYYINFDMGASTAPVHDMHPSTTCTGANQNIVIRKEPSFNPSIDTSMTDKGASHAPRIKKVTNGKSCGVPGCSRPPREGERYCSDSCKEYGDFLEEKYGDGK
jgi:hypothetical protein